MPLYPPIGGALAPTDPSLEDRFDQQFAQGAPPAIGGWDQQLSLPSVPVDVGPGPSPDDLKDNRGFFQRIQDKPGGRNALLAFGAAMLSGNSFLDGFGKAGLAYGQTLASEEEKLRPKISKDGNFQYTWNNQTGEYDFSETAAGLRARQMAREKLETQSDDKRYVANKGFEGKVYTADKTDAFKRDELPYRDKWEDGRNAARIEAARLAGTYSLERTRLSGENQRSKAPPAGVVSLVTEKQGIASKARSTLGMLDGVLHSFQTGQLELGTISNLHGKISQATGIGATEGTRAYAELQRVLQTLSNTKLLDAKGVQTEGDAVRARIESLISAGDTQAAFAELTKARDALQTTADLALAQSDDLTEQYGINNERTREVVNQSGSPRPAAPRRPAAPKSGASSGVKWRIVQ